MKTIPIDGIPVVLNRFNIHECALSGNVIIADPCNLFNHRSVTAEFFHAAEQQIGDRQARLRGGVVSFRNIEFAYKETGGDGFFFGVPVDTGSVAACDLRALASSFGRRELSELL